MEKETTKRNERITRTRRRFFTLDRHRRRYFTLQWHVTAKCSNRCEHCYLMDSPEYKTEIENELSLNDCLRIVDDFYQWIKAWNIQGRINFTGGDPLLKTGIFKLIKYSHNKGITVGILGKPELLTRKVISK